MTHRYDNSIIAFSADNGGAPGVGSNYPLRGCKSTFFEGGVRSVAFLHSPLLPPQSRGTKLDGLMHIADWYASPPFASFQESVTSVQPVCYLCLVC